MKGDIAVAGFRMTAEEWQALDPTSRSELVNVITHKDEPQLAAGSGPIPMEHEAGADSGAVISITDLDPATGAIMVIIGSESSAIVRISELDPPSGAVLMPGESGPTVQVIATETTSPDDPDFF